MAVIILVYVWVINLTKLRLVSILRQLYLIGVCKIYLWMLLNWVILTVKLRMMEFLRRQVAGLICKRSLLRIN